jgi:hypothetical protein
MALVGYAENALLNHVLGGVLYTRPTTAYLDLFTRAPDTNGAGGTTVPVAAGYSGRLAVANNASVFPAASQGVKSSGISLPFGTPTGSTWGRVVGVGLYDAPIAGNLIVYFELVAQITTKVGTPLVLPPSELYLKLRGGWAKALANSVLDHLLGGPSYVPPPVWFYGLLSNGSEATDPGYARQPAPNDVLNFPAAIAGKKSSGVSITFGPAGADWAISTGYALYDALTGGAASMSADLATAENVLNGATTSFFPGDFAFSLD